MCLRGIIRPNESRLVLPCRVLRLAECEAAVSSHTLHSAHLLDCFLESTESMRVHQFTFQREVVSHVYALLLTRTVVRYVILLDFLGNMVRRGHVRPLVTSCNMQPSVVSQCDITEYESDIRTISKQSLY